MLEEQALDEFGRFHAMSRPGRGFWERGRRGGMSLFLFPPILGTLATQAENPSRGEANC